MFGAVGVAGVVADAVEGVVVGQQQMVEIAKALSQDARLLIMDEPTSCLTLSETERLLELIGELKRSGVSVIYISHRLGEIEVCADRVVALRDGKNAGGLKKEEINHEAMVKLMVGRELKGAYVAGSGAGKRTERKLVVRNLRTNANPHRTLNFEAVGGEILGICGVGGGGAVGDGGGGVWGGVADGGGSVVGWEGVADTEREGCDWGGDLFGAGGSEADGIGDGDDGEGEYFVSGVVAVYGGRVGAEKRGGEGGGGAGEGVEDQDGFD